MQYILIKTYQNLVHRISKTRSANSVVNTNLLRKYFIFVLKLLGTYMDHYSFNILNRTPKFDYKSYNKLNSDYLK